jgi:hypothetical protein
MAFEPLDVLKRPAPEPARLDALLPGGLLELADLPAAPAGRLVHGGRGL